MNIGASAASRSMFSKGHVQKHPLWRTETVALSFSTNESNCSVTRAAAGGHVQPNKQGFVHLALPLPTEGPQPGLEVGRKDRRPGPAGDLDVGPSLVFPLPRLRPRTKTQPRWVSVSLWLTERIGLIWVILQNISNNWYVLWILLGK